MIKINRGKKLEKKAGGKLGIILNLNPNAKCTLEPDAWVHGKTFQLKSDKATFGNNNSRELGTDKVADAIALIMEDVSEYFMLIYDGILGTLGFCYTKAEFIEMIKKNPEVVYYDKASNRNGGKKTLRIKVKKKFIQLVYTPNCHEVITLD